jgi:hypothetical protein
VEGKISRRSGGFPINECPGQSLRGFTNIHTRQGVVVSVISLNEHARYCSTAVVDVFKSSDVILIEIGARLHLDEEGGDLSGIGEAMPLADGDVGRLVLGEEARYVTFGDSECAFHHHPVLRSVVVALER